MSSILYSWLVVAALFMCCSCSDYSRRSLYDQTRLDHKTLTPSYSDYSIRHAAPVPRFLQPSYGGVSSGGGLLDFLPLLLLLLLGFLLLQNVFTMPGRTPHLCSARSLDTGRQFTHQQDEDLLNLIKSVDPVDVAVRWNKIRSVDCRKRIICEVHKKLGTSPISHIAKKYIGEYLPGFSKYEDAVKSGLNQLDCAEIYSKCQKNFLQLLTLNK